MRQRSDWQKIGTIGVDAGIVWLGDPCYIMFKGDLNRPEELGRSWHEFCEITQENEAQHGYSDFSGLGVCVPTPHGDGSFEVFAKFEAGVIMELKVVFEPDMADRTCRSCGVGSPWSINDSGLCDECDGEESNADAG